MLLFEHGSVVYGVDHSAVGLMDIRLCIGSIRSISGCCVHIIDAYFHVIHTLCMYILDTQLCYIHNMYVYLHL